MRPDNILYIDIETAVECGSLLEWDTSYPKKLLRQERYCKDKPEGMSAYDYYRERAALFPEFSRIICIVVGWWEGVFFSMEDRDQRDEYDLLLKFKNWLVFDRKIETGGDWKFCGHNLRSFDLPFIAKRMTIAGLSLPKILNLQGMKPREIPHIDTMELWKNGGEVKTSLEAIALCLGLPNPKSDISGVDVSDLYYRDDKEARKRIIEYCQRDVKTTAWIHQRLLVPKPEFSRQRFDKWKEFWKSNQKGHEEMIKELEEKYWISEPMYRELRAHMNDTTAGAAPSVFQQEPVQAPVAPQDDIEKFLPPPVSDGYDGIGEKVTMAQVKKIQVTRSEFEKLRKQANPAIDEAQTGDQYRRSIMQELYGVASSKDLTKQQAMQFIDWIEQQVLALRMNGVTPSDPTPPPAQEMEMPWEVKE